MLARVPHLVEVEPATAEQLRVEQGRSTQAREEHRAAEGRVAAKSTKRGEASREESRT
jgi:hypothetical protein